MPRILLFITDLKIGGTPTVVRELAIRLHRAALPDDYVHVACLDGWGPVADQLHAAGVPVTALYARRATDLGVVGRLTRLIHYEQFDTVLSFLIHANAVAAASSLFCPPVRYLQSIQTTQPRPRWHWRLQRLVHHAAEKIIVPSPSVADAAADWSHIPRQKLIVIPNAVDVDAFRNLPTPPPDARPFPIGFIGRLDPVKRIPDLLDAVKLEVRGQRSEVRGQIPFHLHIFGEGSERPAIEQHIAQLGLTSQVTLHGAVPRPQDALSQIGLLVLPSDAEGFGLVLIEAMAAGVPVVATAVAGIRDVVRDGVTGLLVPPRNPEQLAQAIFRLASDPALRQTLTRNALQDVSARFAWEPVLAQYRKLLLPSDP